MKWCWGAGEDLCCMCGKERKCASGSGSGRRAADGGDAIRGKECKTSCREIEEGEEWKAAERNRRGGRSKAAIVDGDVCGGGRSRLKRAQGVSRVVWRRENGSGCRSSERDERREGGRDGRCSAKSRSEWFVLAGGGECLARMAGWSRMYRRMPGQRAQDGQDGQDRGIED